MTRLRAILRRRGGESGFTLIELLVVIVIESLIVAGIGSAFVLIMNNSNSVKESMARTNDARFAASYIISDAANSSGPETSLSDTTSCADANPPVPGSATAVARFDWDTTGSTGVVTANIVVYVLVSNSLLRRECTGGTLVSDEVVGANIASASVSCSPNADCSGAPTTITASITETQGSSTGAAYQYSLTGAFRKALAVGAPLGPATPQNPESLITLGSGGSCSTGGTGLSLTSSASMRVYGAAYINTVNAACKAMSMTSNSTYAAGETDILSGGTCIATTGSVCPTTKSYTPAIADPYAGLTAPSTSGQPAEAGCPSGHASPGVYAATLSITTACQLASGVYILQNGLSMSGSSAALTTASGGVLIYVTGGTIHTSSSGSLTASAQSTGSYAGVAIWQASADTGTVSFSSGGTLNVSGFLYAPTAEVSITSSAANPTITGIDSSTVFMTSSGKITIGTPSSTPLSIASPASIPTAWTVGQAYPTQTFTGAGGDGNYIWTINGLPTGMTYDSSTGVVSGTPTVAGTYNPTVTLSDLLGDTPVSGGYTITINPVPTITTTSPLPGGQAGTAYSATVAGSGGTTAYSWSATGLPAGLSISAGTGVISGTPTAAGTFPASVTLTDTAGATANKTLSITITGTTITSVVLENNGSTQGKLEKGDSIVITYSAAVSVSSICSAWSGDGSDQSLNTNNEMTVSVSNGAGAADDVLTVTDTNCTFNFGSLDLGSGSYVSAATTFGGPGSNKSSATWTASTHTLTITLGKVQSGTVTTAPSSTPVYTESGSVLDASGAAIANSPFTLTAGLQF